MLSNLVHDHEEDELGCHWCEEQWGQCSCGGVIHCEYQAVFRRDRRTGNLIPVAALVLECDRCDEYEVQ